MPRRKLLDLSAVTADMAEGLREFVAPASDVPTLDDLTWEVPAELVEANPRIEVGDGRAIFRFNGDGGHEEPPRVGTTGLVAIGGYELESTEFEDGGRFVVPSVQVHQEFDALDADELEEDEQQARAEIARHISGRQRPRASRPSARLARLYSPPHLWMQDEAENDAELARLMREQPLQRTAPDAPFVWTTPERLNQLREMRGIIDVPAYIQNPVEDQLLAQRVRYVPQPGQNGPEYLELMINRLIGPTRTISEFIEQFGNLQRAASNILTVSYGSREDPWYVLEFSQVVLTSYQTSVAAGPLSIYEGLTLSCRDCRVAILRAQDSNEPLASFQEP